VRPSSSMPTHNPTKERGMHQHHDAHDLRPADRCDCPASIDPATGLRDDRELIEAQEDANEIDGLELLGYLPDCPWWL
jgi:hypothetical protein